MTPFDYVLTSHEWWALGLVGLVFVLRNWWDIIRYGLGLDRHHLPHRDKSLPH